MDTVPSRKGVINLYSTGNVKTTGHLMIIQKFFSLNGSFNLGRERKRDKETKDRDRDRGGMEGKRARCFVHEVFKLESQFLPFPLLREIFRSFLLLC